MSPHLTLSPAGRRKAMLATAAVGTAGVLAFAGPVAAVLAADETGAPTVATSKTIKADLKADGSVDVARIFTQIQASGNGDVTVVDPTSTRGLRNLNGFGAPSTDNGKATYDISVNGTENVRTVADVSKDQLPVDVNVTYTLDGKQVDPGDLAGKSGKLEVSYDVKNTTAEPTDISYPDGLGKTVKETVDVVTPYVGQLSLDLPDSFDNIASTDNRADQAGNGRGGRLITWTMVLFEPIGQTEQKFGFTADVDGAVLPEAHMQIVPVSPENHPELKFGQDGFANGAQTGRDLTSGADQIDQNLLKLQDGASQLLDGLTQLQDGAIQLSTGLSDGVPAAIDGGNQLADGADTAADGAGQLADGASQVEVGNKQLADGLAQLADGAGQLQTGGHKLRDGVDQLALGFNNPASDKDLVDGSQALAGALGLISGGLGQLNDASKGVPALKAGLVQLRAGVDHPIGAAGPTDPGGLLQGLQQIAGGLSNPNCSLANPTNPANPCGVKEGLAGLSIGLSNPNCSLANPTNPANPCGIKEGLGGIAGGLSNPSCDPTNPANPVNPCGVKQGVDGVLQGLNNALLPAGLPTLQTVARNAYLTDPTPCPLLPGGVIPPPPVPPTNHCELLATSFYGLAGPDGVIAQTTQAAGVLTSVSGGVDTLVGATQTVLAGVTQAFGGLQSIRAGVDRLAVGAVSARNGVTTQLLPGIDLLIGGVSSAVTGIGQLAPGAAQANTGAGDLADGIGTAAVGVSQLQDGANQLSDGLDQVGEKVPDAVSGAQQLATGSAKLSRGTQQLADALQTQLAPGAHQLADGLGDLTAATDGASQIADGLGQATDGNQQIVDGAGQLSEQGTSQLVEAGNDTSKTFGKEYATMQVLNTKGQENALPFGTPEGSDDNRGAYDITIAGVGHEGAGNAGRGIAGLGILAIAAAAATALRGRFG